MSDITFLRHGVLPKKHQNRYNGWSDIPIDITLCDFEKIAPINYPTPRDGGIEEARLEEVQLNPLVGLKDEKFDLIFSSDLIRCTQTLDELQFSYKTDCRLREVKFNTEIEGKSFEEIANLATFKQSYLDSNELWHDYIAAESKREFHNRLKEFLNSLPNNKNILICSHAGAIKEMLNILKNPINEIQYLEFIKIDDKIYKNKCSGATLVH